MGRIFVGFVLAFSKFSGSSYYLDLYGPLFINYTPGGALQCYIDISGSQLNTDFGPDMRIYGEWFYNDFQLLGFSGLGEHVGF